MVMTSNGSVINHIVDVHNRPILRERDGRERETAARERRPCPREREPAAREREPATREREKP